MTPIVGFEAVAATWQNFYLLCGTAAATLIGLMFVAVTFGAGLAPATGNPGATRAFVDPPFGHFTQVLMMSCLAVSPMMHVQVIGVLVIVIAVSRLAYLARVYHHMSEAQRQHNDIELSDWLSGVLSPALCHLALGATGAAFLLGWRLAFPALGVVTMAVLLIGVYGAWELLLWMALMRARKGLPPS
jgi:hypothetical protein